MMPITCLLFLSFEGAKSVEIYSLMIAAVIPARVSRGCEGAGPRARAGERRPREERPVQHADDGGPHEVSYRNPLRCLF